MDQTEHPAQRTWSLSAAALTLLLILTACSIQLRQDLDIDCEPMAYQLENEVWVSAAGEEIRLNEAGLLGVNPALSSDGDRVAFTSGKAEDDLDLYTVSRDGSNRQTVWSGGGLIQSSVDWSADDSHLIFDQYGVEVPLQIFIIPSDGSGQPIQLTDGAPNGKPKWGLNDRILFLSLWDGDAQEIYSMDADGSHPVNLTNNPSRDVLAELSPDQSKIAFASDRAGDGDFDIWIMDPDGANPRRLTERPERETNPTWSSDGNYIIYRSDQGPAGLWFMGSNGSNPAPLLENAWLASCP